MPLNTALGVEIARAHGLAVTKTAIALKNYCKNFHLLPIKQRLIALLEAKQRAQNTPQTGQ